MLQLLEQRQQATQRLHEYIELHRLTPDITLAEHIRRIQKLRTNALSAKKLVYLDTLAWKCLVDYKLQKPKLTKAMVTFAEIFLAKIQNGQYAIPISFPTFLEMDTLVLPERRLVLNELVDELSKGLCIIPQQERIGRELQQIIRGELLIPYSLPDFFCSPVELMGLSYPVLPQFMAGHVDQNTFNKAWFDSMTQMPMSAQLQVAARCPDAKWDNRLGLDSLNESKALHQEQARTLKLANFVELKGCIEAWAETEGHFLEPSVVTHLASGIILTWQSNPTTRAFPTLRTLSALHSVLRADPKRKFKSGDLNDFSVAADALPCCDVFLTDQRLANLIKSKELGLDTLFDCEVIHSFEAMTAYFDN